MRALLIIGILIVLVVILFASGACTIVSEDRVFPKIAPFWSRDAKCQRQSNREEKLRMEKFKNRHQPPASK